MSVNHAILSDSPWHNSFGTENITYYTMNTANNRITELRIYPSQKDAYYLPGGYPLVTYLIQLSDETTTITRQRVTIFDAVSSTGGFAGALLPLFMMIAKLFQRGLYLQHLFKKLFNI